MGITFRDTHDSDRVRCNKEGEESIECNIQKNNFFQQKTKLLTAKEIAEIIKCSVSAIYEWSKSGKIPVYKVNGLLRFEEKEILEWIKAGRLKSKREEARYSKRSYVSEEIEGIISRAIDSVKKGGV